MSHELASRPHGITVFLRPWSLTVTGVCLFFVWAWFSMSTMDYDGRYLDPDSGRIYFKRRSRRPTP